MGEVTEPAHLAPEQRRRVISPKWSEVEDRTRFVPPLSQGELALLRYLDHELPLEWQLYVRPHLDGERPLLAALHPRIGGAVWDVIDWDLSQFTVDRGRWLASGEFSGSFHSPFRFLDQVRERLYGVYVPAIGEALNESATLRPVAASLFFSQATTEAARAMASRDPAARDIAVFGHDALVPGRLQQVIQLREGGSDFRTEWFTDLHQALTHDHHSVDAMNIIDPTPAQRRILRDPRPFTAIDGVVGSGKTVVLALAAASESDEGRVLILTYNRTLTNFIRWFVARVPGRRRPDAITILHFHDLCRRIHDHLRRPLPQRRGSLTRWLDHDWPSSAAAILGEGETPSLLQFRTVIIDEAQDYTEAYLQVVAALEPERVMVAYDSAQRIYEGRDVPTPSLLAKTLGGRRRWQPRTLKHVVRLPRSVADLSREYAIRWGVDSLPIVIAEGGLLPPGRSVGFVHADSAATAAGSVMRVITQWRTEHDFRARDVVVLVPSVPFGSALVRVLAEEGVSTNHVFPVRASGAMLDEGHGRAKRWRVESSRKTSFAVEDSRLKVSTVHSFKGWEAQRVIAVLPLTAVTGRQARTVFVMLTRSRGDLVLIGNPVAFRLDDLVSQYALSEPFPAEAVGRFMDLYREAKRDHQLDVEEDQEDADPASGLDAAESSL